jgi:hypothetical protein
MIIRQIALVGALAIGAVLSGSAYAQQGGGGGGGGMDTGLGDARARDLPTAQGINNGYQNGVYWGSPSGPMVGYNSPPMSYWGGYGYGYGPGPGPAPRVGRSAYAGHRWHKRHHQHW